MKLAAAFSRKDGIVSYMSKNTPQMLRPHSLEMFIFGQFSSNNLWGEKKHKQQGLAPLLRAAASLFEFSFLVNNSHFHVWLLCKKTHIGTEQQDLLQPSLVSGLLSVELVTSCTLCC